MSGLTGYLLSNGITDLSSVFLPNGGGAFTGQISTTNGIIGPLATLTYTSGMIGFTNTIYSTVNNITITNGGVASLTPGFTIPIGVYLFSIFIKNSYSNSSSVPSLTYLNVGMSTSTSGFLNGFGPINSTASQTLISGNWNIIGDATAMMKIESSTQVYYLVENPSFTSLTLTSGPSESSYIKYTRLA